jgi:hypothetical protein
VTLRVRGSWMGFAYCDFTQRMSVAGMSPRRHSSEPLSLEAAAEPAGFAQYLLDLHDSGTPLDELKLAARAIRFTYDQRPEAHYLDPRPIKAALALAEAMRSGRVLN